MGALTGRLGLVLVAALVIASAPVSGPAPAVAASATSAAGSALAASATSAAATQPSLAKLIGQKLVVRMDGVTPSADLLGRIRRGEIGGVILLGANITTRPALIALTGKLRAAAKAGGQPHFLIGIDQEGGSVKRIAWAPPTRSAPHLGALDSTATARAEGAATGAALKALGINIDFAPVADIATTTGFMYRDGRTFSFSAVRTAALADAFASGLESKGVIPAMKHFPGLAFATTNTDASVVRIAMSKTRLAPGLKPYRTAIGHHIPLIMLSNATYSAYDTANAAGWSRAIAGTLLRHDLGFKGVTITDSLNGTAKARGVSVALLAERAAHAGTDLILLTGSEASTRAVYTSLLADARAGAISTKILRASNARILSLKASV